VEPINILILDDDVVSQAALRQVLDSEGWQVHVVTRMDRALAEVARWQARLVIASVSMTGLSGPVFETLRVLAQAEAVEGARTPTRVLYLVPMMAAPRAQPMLERVGLPYLLKPYHLHDFLQKVSDLLIEAGAISTSMVNVQPELQVAPRPFVRIGTRLDKRRTNMFSGRDEYMMTEEELMEYEKQEEEEKKKKIKKRDDFL